MLKVNALQKMAGWKRKGVNRSKRGAEWAANLLNGANLAFNGGWYALRKMIK
jgi:hypothetical protein